MNRTMITVAGCALAALALTPGTATASPAGDLDLSFDGDGQRVLPQPYLANEVLVQEDGKVLVVGDGGPANDFVVTRLNVGGSVDGGYGGDGTAIADFGNQERANAAALQPDGKLVVAGQSRSGTGDVLAVARFNPDGELDPTFDPGGPDGDGKKLISTPPGEPAQFDAAAVLVQPDGRIVLVGEGNSDSDVDMAVTRLTPSGAVDGTAWERGKFDAQALPYAAALTPDGKLVVAGTKHPKLSPSEIALTRFEHDGKLDKSFGGTGKVTFASAAKEEAAAVVVQPDGKIAVAGTSDSGTQRMVVTRFNRDGTLDSSWDGDGRAFPDFDGPSIAAAAALQPDGKVIVAGLGGELDMAAARLNPDGTRDASFGSGGRTTVPGGFIEVAYAVALQPDGRVVLAGQSAAGAPVARLLADPPPATGGGAGGPGGGGGGPEVDRNAPALTGLRLTPARFPRGTRPPTLRAGRARRRSPRIRFTLSEPARVRFTFQRARRGRYRIVPGSFAVEAPAGTSGVRFEGRLTVRRRLAPGRYRLIATPVDRAGNTGRARRTTFVLLAAERQR